ncbi:25954_t:CDS:1 [Dentiscutata erythropus]|uniref:25954_t:CDS:1 n=1 Tax=Dentiscutata erythropus TaxID=1348616 RepID=A0A9N9BKG8_9GLOM|nr:25954_t:CDS:1 [Dentiscutata erythropus]
MAAKIKQIKRFSTIVSTRDSNRRFHTIRRYCVIFRRSTHPYATYTCRRCEQSDQYINSLKDRINNIEKLVKHLSMTIKTTNMCLNKYVPSKNSEPLSSDIDNFSKMETDQLIRLSTQLGARMFGKRDADTNKQDAKDEDTKDENKQDIKDENKQEIKDENKKDIMDEN